MSTSPEPSQQQSMLRTMQIIAASLVLGVLFFLGIALYLVNVQNLGQGAAPAGTNPPLAYLAAGLLAVMIVPALLVPRVLISNGAQRIAHGQWLPESQGPALTSDSGKLMSVLQTAMIVRMAMLEGVSFFAGVAYLTQGQPLALGVMIAGLVLLLLNFPTEGRVQRWLNEQLDAIERIRLSS